MREFATWQRVSRRRPCPVCQKPDWCMFAGDVTDPEAAVCARIESPKRAGQAGWLHVLRDDGRTWSPTVRRIELSAAKIGAATIDFGRLAAACRAAVRPDALDKLAVALGVSVASLRRLGVGWSKKHRAWSFPMHNVAGDVLGIRLRLPGGEKLSVKGGHEGLFIPEGFDLVGGLLLVTEGASDTAALLDLGFSAVGRPSCTGGVWLLVELVRKLKPSGVVIVADGDAPGQRGAERLAAALVAYSASVRIITPPSGVKDAREWKRCGATHADVQATIDAAAVRKLRVSVRKRKAGHDAKRS